MIQLTRRTFFLPQSKYSIVLCRCSRPLSFQKRNVEERWIVIDELEQIDFQRQTVVVLRLSSSILKVREKDGKIVIEVVEDGNDDKVDDARGDWKEN